MCGNDGAARGRVRGFPASRTPCRRGSSTRALDGHGLGCPGARCRSRRRRHRVPAGDRHGSVVDAQGQRKIVPGTIDVWLGGGQPDTRAAKASLGVRVAFEVMDAATLPE